MSSPLAEAFFLWTILTVVMKHPLILTIDKTNHGVFPFLDTAPWFVLYMSDAVTQMFRH